MPDFDDEHVQACALDARDNAVVADAVAPVAVLPAAERFAETGGILRPRDALIEVAHDLSLSLPIQLP